MPRLTALTRPRISSGVADCTDHIAAAQQHQRSRRHRADPGGRAQVAEYLPSRVQNVLSEGGQQRRRSSEQYRKEIQRNGTQHRFAAPDEPQTLEQPAPGDRNGLGRGTVAF